MLLHRNMRFSGGCYVPIPSEWGDIVVRLKDDSVCVKIDDCEKKGEHQACDPRPR